MNTKSIYKSTSGQAEIMALYNKVLSQWPVPNEHRYVSTRYGDTFVIAGGDTFSPPLVLLHGSASNSATWAGDVIEYSKYFRVYAVDIPGEPGKSDPNRFSWAGPAFTEWLDDVLNRLKLEKVILGGMSLGAWATIKYALDKPERVNQAILICPSGVYPPRLSFLLQVIFLSLLGEWGHNRLKQLIFRGISLPQELDQFLTLIGRHFNYRLGSPPLFTDEELQSLTLPVLFLAGEKDALLNTPKTAERLQKLVPDLTVNILKEDGHAVINMAPQVVSFLRQIEVV
jgi:pimeloyl-ACP methyl ester carboxylesterase